MRLALVAGLSLALSSMLPRSASAAAAVTSVATRLAAELAAPEGCVVAFAPLRSDEPVPRGEELAQRIAESLAATLPNAQLLTGAHSVQSAWKLAGNARRLIHVQAALVRGSLEVNADMHGRDTNVWERLKGKRVAPAAHGFASAPIDAEVRSFLPPLSLERAVLKKYTFETDDVLALACGEIDARPGVDLAVLTRRELSIGHLQGARFVSESRTALERVGTRTPVGSRPALGSVVATGELHRPLALGSSDWGSAVLDADLRLVQRLSGFPLGRGEQGLLCADLDPARGGFTGPLAVCGQPSGAAAKGELSDVLASHELVGRDGTTSLASARREPSGRLSVRIGGRTQNLEGVGAQLALGDFDQDGVLDLAYTLDSDNDALSLASFDGERVRLRRRWKSDGPIKAVAVCPADGMGQTAVAAVLQRGPEAAEVWLVR